MRERRAPRPDLGDLRRLLGVLAEDRARPRVLEHVQALLGRVGGIDRDHDRRGAHGADVGERPFRPRVGEDRHAVAALDAERHEPARDLTSGGAERGIGDVDPPPVALVAKRSAVVAFGRAQEEVAEALSAGRGLGRVLVVESHVRTPREGVSLTQSRSSDARPRSAKRRPPGTASRVHVSRSPDRYRRAPRAVVGETACPAPPPTASTSSKPSRRQSISTSGSGTAPVSTLTPTKHVPQ